MGADTLKASDDPMLREMGNGIERDEDLFRGGVLKRRRR